MIDGIDMGGYLLEDKDKKMIGYRNVILVM